MSHQIIAFTHGDKLISLGPSAIMEDDHFFKNTKETVVEGGKNSIKNDDNNNKLLIIDGMVYSLYEIPTTKSKEVDKGESNNRYIKKIIN